MNTTFYSDPSGVEGSNVRPAWVGDSACCGDLVLCVPFSRRAAPQCMSAYEYMYFVFELWAPRRYQAPVKATFSS